MSYIDEQTRNQRAAVYRPLIEVTADRGIRWTWLAARLGVTRQRLWNYLHGHDRMPDGFVERACRELSIPPSFISIPEPHDLYIQQPRKRTPAQSQTPVAGVVARGGVRRKRIPPTLMSASA